MLAETKRESSREGVVGAWGSREKGEGVVCVRGCRKKGCAVRV